jgi:hypothetical protein
MADSFNMRGRILKSSIGWVIIKSIVWSLIKVKLTSSYYLVFDCFIPVSWLTPSMGNVFSHGWNFRVMWHWVMQAWLMLFIVFPWLWFCWCMQHKALGRIHADFHWLVIDHRRYCIIWCVAFLFYTRTLSLHVGLLLDYAPFVYGTISLHLSRLLSGVKLKLPCSCSPAHSQWCIGIRQFLVSTCLQCVVYHLSTMFNFILYVAA